jgi:hypothetical protein
MAGFLGPGKTDRMVGKEFHVRVRAACWLPGHTVSSAGIIHLPSLLAESRMAWAVGPLTGSSTGGQGPQLWGRICQLAGSQLGSPYLGVALPWYPL